MFRFHPLLVTFVLLVPVVAFAVPISSLCLRVPAFALGVVFTLQCLYYALESSRIFRRLLLYAALLIGAAAFSLPFLWLVSTSIKTNREIMTDDLRLFPEIPSAARKSPYVDPYLEARIERPEQIPETLWRDEAWKRSVEQNVAERLKELDLGSYPNGLPAPMAEALAPAYWKTISRAVGRSAWDRAPGELASSLVSAVDAERSRTIIEKYVRRVSLGRLRARGWHLQNRTILPDDPVSHLWKIEPPGVARLIDKTDEAVPYADLEYDFASSNRFTLTAEVPLEFSFYDEEGQVDLKKLILPLRADDSWNRFECILESAGRRFVAKDPLYLGRERWGEFGFQLPSYEDQSIRIKTWIRMEEVAAAPDTLEATDAVRLTLRFKHVGRFGALFAKAGQNYLDSARFVTYELYFRNSAILVASNVILQLLACSLVAYSFARLRWPGRTACFLLLLSTMMLPGLVLMIPGFLIIRSLGLYNTWWPLILGSAFGSPFFIFLLRQFMKGIPKDLEDAAMIDGAGFFGIYRLVILPLLKPALAAIAIFQFMATWNDFMGPLIYLTDQRTYPVSLGLFTLNVTAGGSYGMVMAASFLVALPVILTFFVAQKYFIQGITLTGMKG